MRTSRLEFVFDGVFAIAATFLGTGVPVDAGAEDLLAAGARER